MTYRSFRDRANVKPVSLADASFVTKSYFNDEQLPLVVKPTMEIDLANWASEHRGEIERDLSVHGAILFRSFRLTDPAAFERFIRSVAQDVLPYTERSSPRTQVQGNVYTSTDYPADQSIFLHNEQSYNVTFPSKIFFCCMEEAATGGETPLADCRKVYERISPATRRALADGYTYVRNFRDGMGLSWRETFGTSRATDVEQYCRQNSISYEWQGDYLRTRQIRPVVAKHPITGELSWFNHLTFFHVSTLPVQIQKDLRNLCGDDLPNNTYHADGRDISPDMMEELRTAYSAGIVSFPWRRGDALMVDNLLTCHGRAPFTGRRSVIVGMADAHGWNRSA